MGNIEKTSTKPSNGLTEGKTTWYAVMQDGSVIANGESYGECSWKALAVCGDWLKIPGSVAPYTIQTFK